MDIQSLTTQIDNYLAPLYPAGAPGIAALLAKDGQVLFRKAYGLANLEWGIPNTPETVFRIGSITKQFTAVSILMLIEQGKLALDDPIQKFLPEYPTHGHTITIEHLLTHTSGIKSYTSMKEWQPAWGREFEINELIDFFKNQPMDFAPGTKWSYNNSAYVLLGVIIEKVAGVPYDVFLQEHICQPLGLKDTQLELPRALIPRKAYGYSKTPDGAPEKQVYKPSPYLSMTQPLGAGGMVSSVDDLLCWETAITNGSLVTTASLKRAHTACILPDGSSTHYGYGWFVHKYEYLDVIDHSGGIHGFVCNAVRMPERGLFAVVLGNDGSPRHGPDSLAFCLLMLGAGRPLPAPQRAPVTESALDGLEGVFEMWPGADLTITRAGARLMVTQPGDSETYELVPVADGQFTPANRPLWKLTPARGDDGQAKSFTATDQYGEEVLTVKRKTEDQPAA